jgi:SM-20-related protein
MPIRSLGEKFISMEQTMFSLNPNLDREGLSRQFKLDGRIQIRDILDLHAARNLAHLLEHETAWGLAWQGGRDSANMLRATEFQSTSPEKRVEIGARVNKAMSDGEYGFQFGSYPMLDAYMGKWDPDGMHDRIFEHINDQPFLNLVRQVTGISEIKKADAQATIYAPGHFLAQHDDSHVAQGWKVAYVLNLCPLEWRSDWGGYLNFLDDDGDIIVGWKPRFNTLNLFRVPQPHQVTFVPPFAPLARFAITGWFRDR